MVLLCQIQFDVELFQVRCPSNPYNSKQKISLNFFNNLTNLVLRNGSKSTLIFTSTCFLQYSSWSWSMFFFSYRPSNNSQVLNLFSNKCLINLPSTYRLKIVYGKCCLKVSWGIINETCKINTSSIGFFKTYLTNPTCDMVTNSFTYLVLIVWGTTMVLIKKRLGSMANIKFFFIRYPKMKIITNQNLKSFGFNPSFWW